MPSVPARACMEGPDFCGVGGFLVAFLWKMPSCHTCLLEEKVTNDLWMAEDKVGLLEHLQAVRPFPLGVGVGERGAFTQDPTSMLLPAHTGLHAPSAKALLVIHWFMHLFRVFEFWAHSC